MRLAQEARPLRRAILLELAQEWIKLADQADLDAELALDNPTQSRPKAP